MILCIGLKSTKKVMSIKKSQANVDSAQFLKEESFMTDDLPTIFIAFVP